MSASLRALQQSFAAAIINASSAPEQVLSDEQGSADARLNIYSSAYRLRHIEALKADFSGVHRLLGDDGFAQMTQEYLRAHPPVDPSIRWFGASLPTFVTQHAPWKDSQWLRQMAQFDWARSTVFDAQTQTPLSLAEFAEQVSPETLGDLRFAFISAMQQCTLGSNLPKYWRQLFDHPNEEIESAELGALTQWLVWRSEHKSHWVSLDTDEALVLRLAQEGSSVMQMAEALAQHHPSDQALSMIMEFISGWLNTGLIATTVPTADK